MTLLQTVARALRTRCALPPQAGPLLLAVSGGLDSMVLLEALHRLGYALTVAHFNHQLRPAAVEEARFVAAEAARRGLPFVGGEGEVRALAAAEGRSLEEAARQLRYRFLFAQARRLGAAAVVTAHQADDQAETVLLHLLRGSGLRGLGGMAWRSCPTPWDASIPLVRPLLGLTRAELAAWARAEGLQWREDVSNADLRFTRNRLRHEALPLLETFNPNLRRALGRMAETLRAEEAWLRTLTEAAAADLPLERGADWLSLPLEALRRLPLALQRRLWRGWLTEALGATPDWETVEAACALAADGPPRDLPGGWRLWREGGRALLARRPPRGDFPQLPAGAAAGLRLPGRLALGEGWVLRAELQPLDAALWARVRANRDPFRAWLDAARLGNWLTLRGPRPGDRLRPLGLGGGSLKLQDVFVNLKIPARARASWPLLCVGGRLAWVPGYRMDVHWALRAESKTACALVLERRSDV